MNNNKKTIIAILLWGGVNIVGMELEQRMPDLSILPSTASGVYRVGKSMFLLPDCDEQTLTMEVCTQMIKASQEETKKRVQSLLEGEYDFSNGLEMIKSGFNNRVNNGEEYDEAEYQDIQVLSAIDLSGIEKIISMCWTHKATSDHSPDGVKNVTVTPEFWQTMYRLQARELEATNESLKEKRQLIKDLNNKNTTLQSQLDQTATALQFSTNTTENIFQTVGIASLGTAVGLFLGSRYASSDGAVSLAQNMGVAGFTSLAGYYVMRKKLKQSMPEIKNIEEDAKKGTYKYSWRDLLKASWVKKCALSFGCFSTAFSSVMYKDVIINWGKAGGSKVMDFLANLRRS